MANRKHFSKNPVANKIIISKKFLPTVIVTKLLIRHSPPPKCARSPGNTAGSFRERSRSPQQRRQFPSPPRFPNRERSGSPGERDIGDEIQEEIRRQKRRQEEERRREERRRRHQKREEMERRGIDERKKRE